MSTRSLTPSLILICLVLAAAPWGEGGRGADALLLTHTALLMAAGCSLYVFGVGGLFGMHRALLLVLPLFCVYAYAMTPYRYTTKLVLSDLLAAALVYLLLCRILHHHPTAVRWVAVALGVGVATQCVALTLARFGVAPSGGLFPNPNHGAGYVVVGAAACWALGLAPATPLRLRLPAVAAALALAGMVGIMGSRGPLAAFLLACFVPALIPGRRLLLLLPVVLAALIALTMPAQLGKRLQRVVEGDPYAWERLEIWGAAGRMTKDHLWRGGAGLGLFADRAPQYNFPVEGARVQYGKITSNAHNEYLEALAEASLPGLLLLLVPLVWLLVVLYRQLRGRDRRPAALAAAAALTAVAAHAFVDSALRLPALLNASAALLAVLATKPDTGGQVAGVRPGSVFRVGALAVLATAWMSLVVLPWEADRRFQRAAGTVDPVPRAQGLESALQLEPDHAGYLVRLAESRWEAGEADDPVRALAEAEGAFDRALRVHPVSPSTARRRAHLLHRVWSERLPDRELFEAARVAYKQAVRLDPMNPLLAEAAALLELQAGAMEQALPLLERALELEPRFLGARALLARALEQLGMDQRAAAQRVVLEETALQVSGLVPGSSYEAAIWAPPASRLAGGGAERSGSPGAGPVQD